MSRLPLWLKILVLIFALSLIVDLSGPLVYFVFPAFLLALMMFPGSSARGPRLMRVYPWLLGLEGLTALVMLVMLLRGMPVAQTEVFKPRAEQLWLGAISSPILLVAYVKRVPWFRALLIVTTVLALGEAAWSLTRETQDTQGILEYAADLVSGLMLTVYVYKNYRTKR